MTLKNIDYKLPSVSLDKEQLSTLIQNDIQEYHETTEGFDTAKKRAAIKKIITHYEDQRKNITRQWDDVKKDFMGVVKDALAPAIDIESELAAIIEDEKLKEKTEKESLIKELNNASIYLTYYEFNPKWYNKTATLKEIQAEINETVERIDRDKTLIHNQATLFSLDSEYYLKLLPQKSVTEIFDIIAQDNERIKAQTKQTPQTATVSNNLTIEGFIESLKAFDPIANKSAKKHILNVTYVATRDELQLLADLRKLLGVEVK